MIKSRHWTVIAFLCCAAFSNARAQSATQLFIRVHLPDGSPAKGVKVQIVQLERSFPRNFLCGLTDNRGQLTVDFQPHVSKDDEHYGWGVYRFVVMSENLRWELSDIYYWNKISRANELENGIRPESGYKNLFRGQKTNWAIGRVIQIQEGKPQIWNVTLHRGEAVPVSVKDQFGNVIPRSKINVFLDTDMLGHTGNGGEIPIFSAQTDEKGELVVPHAAAFVYSFDYQSPTAGICEYCRPEAPYFSTVVRSTIGPKSATIVYQRRIPHKISVSVIDGTSKVAISGAIISELMVFSSSAQGGPIGTTDAKGQFQTDRLYTENVLSLGVHKDGYQDFEFDMKNFQPGASYVFELKAK